MEIKYVEDRPGNKVLPVTSLNAVRDANNNTLDTILSDYKSTINSRLDSQDTAIEALNGNNVIPVDTVPEVYEAEINTIYRLVGTNSYTDYMVDTSVDPYQMKQIATYTFPGIDVEPTAGSDNLVKSNGIFNSYNEETIVENEIVGGEYYWTGGAPMSSDAYSRSKNLVQVNAGETVRLTDYRADTNGLCIMVYTNNDPTSQYLDEVRTPALTKISDTEYTYQFRHSGYAGFNKFGRAPFTPFNVLLKKSIFVNIRKEIDDIMNNNGLMIIDDMIPDFYWYDSGIHTGEGAYSRSPYLIYVTKGSKIHLSNYYENGVGLCIQMFDDKDYTNPSEVRATSLIPIDTHEYEYTFQKSGWIGINQLSLTEKFTATISINNINDVVAYLQQVWDEVDGLIRLPFKKWTGLGDSLTYQDSYYVGLSWSPQVEEKTGFKFYNCGQGSTCIAGTGASAMWQDVRLNAVKATDPDVLTILGGANDLANNILIGDESMFEDPIAEKDTTYFLGAYSYIIETLLTWKPSLRIVIMTTSYSWNDGVDVPHSSGLTMGDYADASRKVAHYYGLPLIDLYYNQGINKITQSYYTIDSIHWNANGSKVVAQLVISKFRELFCI